MPRKRNVHQELVAKHGEPLVMRKPNITCPHCGSAKLDLGATGLDLCEDCGGLSRGGKTLTNAEGPRISTDGDVTMELVWIRNVYRDTPEASEKDESTSTFPFSWLDDDQYGPDDLVSITSSLLEEVTVAQLIAVLQQLPQHFVVVADRDTAIDCIPFRLGLNPGYDNVWILEER